MITIIVRFLVDGAVLPVIEELYFRGYLLPRIPGPGSMAVWLNAVLFTIYHLWQPFNYPTILVLALLLAFTVKRTRSVWVGVSIHTLLNVIGSVLGLLIMLKH